MLVHHRRDLVAGQPARRRRAGKPEAGQGEHHDAEGIGGCRVVCRRAGEQRQQLPMLEEQAGPAATAADLARTGCVHYMHRDFRSSRHASERASRDGPVRASGSKACQPTTQNHRAPHPLSMPTIEQDFEKCGLELVIPSVSGKSSPLTPHTSERKRPRCAMTRQASTW